MIKLLQLFDTLLPSLKSCHVAITATAGGLTAPVQPKRPSWADMHKHYPAKTVTTDVLYNTMIKGKFKGHQNTSYLANTCATRMSYALLHSGFHLAQTKDTDGSMLGEDKKWYWIRVSDLKTELKIRFKGFDAELKFDEIDKKLYSDDVAMAKCIADRKAKAQKFLDTELAKKNGIIVFRVKGWGDASGHFTLWDSSTKTLAFATGHDDNTKDSYYPWLTMVTINPKTLNTVVIQVAEIQFWELK